MNFITHSPDETEELGRRLGRLLAPGDQLHVNADLGVGKTVLARGLIRACVEDEVEVTSPTFSLVQSYEGKILVTHADLYRIEDAHEVLELGLDDALEGGILIIEWPRRGEGYLPKGARVIEGEQLNEMTRQWTFQGDESWQQRLKQLERA
ncbi:MAG: tRNA (adenosine(37)-N6)-threonylcarbamoyltransferase complex ATPase subunit type 1 TsaE [Pseudomonadota bacterium]